MHASPAHKEDIGVCSLCQALSFVLLPLTELKIQPKAWIQDKYQMQRVKDVLQSIFHLDICSSLTLSQLVCVNLALYHTQILCAFHWCSLWGSLSLPVLRGHSVCWDVSAAPASPWDYFLCSLLEIRDTFKGMGAIWNHVLVCILLSHTMKIVNRWTCFPGSHIY